MEVGTTSLTFFYGIYYVGWFLINLLAGVYIYRDAKKLPQLFLNSKPIWWFFHLYFLVVYGAFLYIGQYTTHLLVTGLVKKYIASRQIRTNNSWLFRS